MKTTMHARWFHVGGVFAVLGMVTWAVFRFMPVDYSKEEEPFCSMAMPPCEVFGTIWMDGGSVSIRVTDKRNQIHEFILPFDHSVPWTPYPKAYRGVFDMNEFPSKGTLMKDAERTRMLAIGLLENHGIGGHENTTRSTLNYLRRGSRFDPISLPEKMNQTLRDVLAR